MTRGYGRTRSGSEQQGEVKGRFLNSEGQSGRFGGDPRRDPNSDPERDPRTIQLDRLGSPWISGAAREALQKPIQRIQKNDLVPFDLFNANSPPIL